MGWLFKSKKKKDDDDYNEDDIDDSNDDKTTTKKKKKSWFGSSKKSKKEKVLKTSVTTTTSTKKLTKKEEAIANERRRKEKEQEEEIRARKQAAERARIDQENRLAAKRKEEEEEMERIKQLKDAEKAKKKKEDMERKKLELAKKEEVLNAKHEAKQEEDNEDNGEDDEDSDENDDIDDDEEDEDGEERRYAADGELYTKVEFFYEYDGFEEWEEAVPYSAAFELEKSQLEELWQAGHLKDDEYEEGLELAATMAATNAELVATEKEEKKEEKRQQRKEERRRKKREEAKQKKQKEATEIKVQEEQKKQKDVDEKKNMEEKRQRKKTEEEHEAASSRIDNLPEDKAHKVDKGKDSPSGEKHHKHHTHRHKDDDEVIKADVKVVEQKEEEKEERRYDGNDLFTFEQFESFYGGREEWDNAVREEVTVVETVVTDAVVKEERRWDGDSLFTQAEFLGFYGSDEAWNNAIPEDGWYEEKEQVEKKRKSKVEFKEASIDLASPRTTNISDKSNLTTSPRIKKKSSFNAATPPTNTSSPRASKGYFDSCASFGIEKERVTPKKATVKEIELQLEADSARLLKVLEEEKMAKLKLERERLELLKQQRADAAAERLDMKAKQLALNPLPKSVPKVKPYVAKKLKQQPSASLLLLEGKAGQGGGIREKKKKAIKYENYLGSTPTLMDEQDTPTWKKIAKIDENKKKHREEAKRLSRYVESKQLARLQQEQRKFEEEDDYMNSGYNAYGRDASMTIEEEFGEIEEGGGGDYYGEEEGGGEETKEEGEGLYEVKEEEEEEEEVDEGEYLNKTGVLKVKRKKVKMVMQAEAYCRDAALFLHRQNGELNQQWIFEMTGTDRIRAYRIIDVHGEDNRGLVLEAGQQIHVHGHGVHQKEEIHLHLQRLRDEEGEETRDRQRASYVHQRWFMDEHGFIIWKQEDDITAKSDKDVWVLGWSYTKHLKSSKMSHVATSSGSSSGGGARIVLVKKNNTKQALRFKFKDVNDESEDVSEDEDDEEEEVEEEEEDEVRTAWWKRGKGKKLKQVDVPTDEEELGFVGRLKLRRAKALEEKKKLEEKQKLDQQMANADIDASDSFSTVNADEGGGGGELGWVGRLKERRARSLEAKETPRAAGGGNGQINQEGEELGWVGRLKERRARSLEAKENPRSEKTINGGEKQTEEVVKKVGWWGKAKQRISERKSAKEFEEEILKSKSSSILTPQPKKQYRNVNDVVAVTGGGRGRGAGRGGGGGLSDITLSPILPTRETGTYT